MQNERVHSWIVAPYQADREALWQTLRQDETQTFVLNCHQNMRGPYTGCGELLRQFVPGIYERQPELVKAHAIEILSVAPELKTLITLETETLTSLAIPAERTRFYGRARTLRLAHGLVDFLRLSINHDLNEHYTLFFDNAHTADSLDMEFLAIALRRLPAQEIRIVIGTTPATLPDDFARALATHTCRIQAISASKDDFLLSLQADDVPAIWQDWLMQHCGGWRGERQSIHALVDLLPDRVPHGTSFTYCIQMLIEQAPPSLRETLARAYIASDATSDCEAEQIAYKLIEPVITSIWHDERAEELELLQQWSLQLGAIPYHREHGQDPSEVGARSLCAALDYCIDMGYYEATVALAHRGRKIIDWRRQEEYYWTFTTKATTSLAALERPEEAEELYNEARALSSNPALHMQAAYATAMLYTRHHTSERRNLRTAKGWIHTAIAISQLFPNPKERAFHSVFNQNGLALIEVRMGNPQEALRLVTEGLERLDRELELGEHKLHRSVLIYNRAQVYAAQGQLEQALEDYTAVIGQDPYYSEYYFDRGSLYRRMGREPEALEDYERAIRYSPPYPEAYYNRASVLSVLGRSDEALDDYNYVLELEPDHLEARINHASILYEQGEYQAAYQDVQYGLALHPTSAQLLCTLGLIAMAEERNNEAYYALTAAIELDEGLAAAWSNRAILSFECGEIDAAINDLSSALALGENATVYYNRGLAYQAKQQREQAINDFSQALALSDDDAPEILHQLSILQANSLPS